MKSIKSRRLFCLSFLLCFIINTYGQETENINLSVGLGHPELINLGVRFQLEQSQLGLFVGAMPGSEESGFAAGADYYYHFGGTSEFSARKPWYAKAGLNYLHNKDEFDEHKYVLLVPRIGRDFNLSSKFGIAIEAGVSAVLSRKETEIKPRESSGFFDGSGSMPDLIPSLGFNFFYRL